VLAVFLAALSAGAIALFLARGELLHFGDAAAHINIARRVLDSRTPGWEQIGTVWLPLPHVLMLPLVGYDQLWRSGVAGSIPSGACFVLAGVLLFLAARRVFGSNAAAAAAALLLALNPNLLYMQAIPMTEALFLACLAGVLYFTVRFQEEQSWGSLVGAAAFCLAGALTRYEGWFLIPFVTGFFLVSARRRRVLAACVFGAITSLGPLYWLWHNYYFHGNALEFYSGIFSAKAIYQRALAHGEARYPGDGDWRTAARYVGTAIRLCAGWPLAALAIAGAALSVLRRRALWPLLLLLLPPVFYIWSVYSGGTPIFLPWLWPFSYYNARYGIAALPLLALAAAGVVAVCPERWRRGAATLAVLAAISPWLGYPRAESWVCWKESQVNSVARRSWTRQAAEYFRANYRRGDGILTSSGDLPAIFQQAGIHLKETLADYNRIPWRETIRGVRPVREKWVVAISGSEVAQVLERTRRTGPRYDLVKRIAESGAPAIEIYRRNE
jgi:hypothetical protein